MGALFGAPKPKPDKAMQRAQRRQDRALSQQEDDAAAELGARRRLMNARAQGRGSVASLFAPASSATGETLGG